MKDYQVRVCIEAAELAEKIERLEAFLNDEKKVDEGEEREIELLNRQLDSMKDYLSCLGDRIKYYAERFDTLALLTKRYP